MVKKKDMTEKIENKPIDKRLSKSQVSRLLKVIDKLTKRLAEFEQQPNNESN